MNWLMREAGRVAVRRVVYLVIAALIGLASTWWNTAAAQDVSHCNDTSNDWNMAYCQTDAEARVAHIAWVNAYLARLYGAGRGTITSTYHCPAGTFANTWCSDWVSSTGHSGSQLYAKRWKVVDPCSGLPPDPENPGQCMSEDKCRARNADLGDSTGTRAFTSNTNTTSCVGGCMMDFSGQTSPVRKGKMWNAQGLEVSRYFVTGEYKYNGQMCGPSYTAGTTEQQNTKTETKESAKPKAEECEPVGTQTMCRKGNGDFCATARTGRQICWGPHELGSKADGDFLQTKKPGTSNGPDTMALSNGDTATKTNDVRIKEETKAVNGETRSSDSVISTYKTNSGADAGPTSQGQPTSTAGVGAGGGSPEGEDDGDEDGQASGGGNCKAAPTCSGDPIQCAQLQQAWLARCSADTNDNGQPDWTEVDDMNDDPSSVFNDSVGEGKFWAEGNSANDGSQLDQSGWTGGGGSCPALTSGGGGGELSGEFAQALANPSPEWCNYIRAIYAIVLVLATIAGVYIVAGKKGD